MPFTPVQGMVIDVDIVVVTGLCDVVLHVFLDLLSLEAFIQILPELLERTQAQVCPFTFDISRLN